MSFVVFLDLASQLYIVNVVNVHTGKWFEPRGISYLFGIIFWMTGSL